MEMIVGIIIGLILGLIIGILIARGQKQALVTQCEVFKSQISNSKEQADALVANMQTQLNTAKTEAEKQLNAAKMEWQQQIANAKAETERHSAEVIEAKDAACKEALKAKDDACKGALEAKDKSCQEALSAQDARHQEATNSMQERFDVTMKKVSAEMKMATDEMLKQRQKEFADASNTNLGQIVNPLRETIDKMKQAMSDSTLKQTAMSSEMKVKLEDLMKHSEAAKTSADELANVLKHKSKIQGNWGEQVLAKMLEDHGLIEGENFDVQEYIKDANGNKVISEEGHQMIPDVIIHLTGNREIIVDSKVSLTAFYDYVNAKTDEEQKKYLKAHIDSIKAHVKELSSKDYSSYIKVPKIKMDYVIMFVPNTGALWTAINSEPDLWRNAMESNVYIADEQTMFAALRIISMTWTQVAQAQNHERVYELANEMLNRVGRFMKNYKNIGEAIIKAQKAYDDGEKKLDVRGQSIIQTCYKLQKLGAKQSNKNPLPQIDDTTGIQAIEETEENDNN